MSQVEDYPNPWRDAYRGHPGPCEGKTRRLVASVATCFLLFSGCLNRAHHPYVGPASERPVLPRLVAFGASLEPLEPDVTVVRTRSERHRKLALSASSVADNGQEGSRIHATFFESTADTPRPLVVVLPIWGVSAYPPRQIVRRLVHSSPDRQVNVLWVHGEQRLFDWESVNHVETEAEVAAILASWTAAAAGTVIDIRRLIAWARERPSTARHPVTMAGFSIGAIVSALVAGTDDHVAGGVFVFGGAHVDEIVRHCGGKARRFREAVAARTTVSEERLAVMLRTALDPIDPVHYTGTVDPRKILIIDASRDDCIPDPAREDFWVALGRPERLSVGYNHRRAFLTMTPVGLHRGTRDVVSYLQRIAFDLPRRPSSEPRAVHHGEAEPRQPDPLP